MCVAISWPAMYSPLICTQGPCSTHLSAAALFKPTAVSSIAHQVGIGVVYLRKPRGGHRASIAVVVSAGDVENDGLGNYCDCIVVGLRACVRAVQVYRCAGGDRTGRVAGRQTHQHDELRHL